MNNLKNNALIEKSFFLVQAKNPQHEVHRFLTNKLQEVSYSTSVRPRQDFDQAVIVEIKYVLQSINELV